MGLKMASFQHSTSKRRRFDIQCLKFLFGVKDTKARTVFYSAVADDRSISCFQLAAQGQDAFRRLKALEDALLVDKVPVQGHLQGHPQERLQGHLQGLLQAQRDRPRRRGSRRTLAVQDITHDSLLLDAFKDKVVVTPPEEDGPHEDRGRAHGP